MKIYNIFVLLLLLTGCTGPSIKTFNGGSYKDNELVTITAHQEEGIFGSEIRFDEVDDKKAWTPLAEQAPTTIRVTPGEHVLRAHYINPSLSLNRSYQNLYLEFALNAIQGNEYKVYFSVEKSLAEKFTIGGELSGWVENLTTGEKLPLLKPSSNK